MTQPHFLATMTTPRKAVLEIYDRIGPSRDGMIDARMISDQLSRLGELDEIDLLINSLGGVGYEGVAIFNLLHKHPAKKRVQIIGLAGSAATLPMLVGETISIPPNAMVMIHSPMMHVSGGEKDLQAALGQLRSTKQVAARMYSQRTGIPEARIVEMMDAETWLTGTEAVELGFCTTLLPELTLPEPVTMQASDLSPYCAHPPEQFFRLAALTAHIPKGSTMTTPTAPTAPANPAPAAPAQPLTAPTATPVPATPAATLAMAAPLLQSVTEPPTKSAAELVQEAIAQERQRVASITALCSAAGKPELAQKHIDDGTAVMVVQTSLFTILCAERPPVGSSNSTMSAATGDDKYKQEYALQRDVYLKAGVSEEQYIKTRRIDDAGGEVRPS